MIACVASLLLPTIWIVDAQMGPGAQFADLPAAIAAAANGDTILVRAGTYTGANLVGKALTIRGAGAAATLLTDAPGAQPNRVANAAGVTVLAGLRIDGSGTGLVVQTAQVVLLDCEIHGGDATFFGGAGLEVAASGHVTASRCAFHGGDGLSPSSLLTLYGGGRAVGVANGGTFAGDVCVLRGGDCPGPYAGIHQGGVGLASSGQARLDRSQCRGGDSIGTPGQGAFATSPGTIRVCGGPGALLAAGQGAVAGMAMQNYFGTAIVHPPLVASGTFASTVQTGAPFPRLAVAGTTLPDGATDAQQPVVVTYDGLVPNGAYFFALGFAPDYSMALAPLADSELLLDLATGGGWIGVLDAAGQFQFGFVPTQVFGGLLGIPVFAQAASFEPVAGKLHTSNVDVRLYAL